MLVLQAHSELELRGAPASLKKLSRTAATFAGFADPRYARIARTARTRAPPLGGVRAYRV